MGKGKIVVMFFVLLFVGFVNLPHSSVLAEEQNSIILEHSQEWRTFDKTVVLSVFVSDVDGDDVTEIVTGGYVIDENGVLHSQLRIWNWNGTTLTLEHSDEWAPPAGFSYIFSVHATDVDADGLSEIITGGHVFNGSHSKAQLRIWNWNATNQQLTLEHNEEWAPATGVSGIFSVLAGDVDDDSTIEIVTGGLEAETDANYQGQIRIWNWDGMILTLEHSEEWSTMNLTIVRSVSLGDVDRDGLKEILTGGYLWVVTREIGPGHTEGYNMGQLRIWNWNGSFLALEFSKEWNETDIYSVFAGDVYGDGSVEILTAAEGFKIWNWNGTTIWLEQSKAWDFLVMSILSGDIDADGLIEVITGGYVYSESERLHKSQLRTWIWNGSTLTLEQSEEWSTSGDTFVLSVFLGDVDADGMIEIVTGGEANGYGQLRIWSFPDETPPIADAGLNRRVVEDTVVSFDAGNSYDVVGIVSYEWDFGDGTTGTGVSATHAYASAGTFTVTLTVTDAAGNSAIDTLTITVTEVPIWQQTWFIGAVVGGVAVVIVVIIVLRRRGIA